MIDREKITLYVSEMFSFERMIVSSIFIGIGILILGIFALVTIFPLNEQTDNAISIFKEVVVYFLGLISGIVSSVFKNGNGKQKVEEIKSE